MQVGSEMKGWWSGNLDYDDDVVVDEYDVIDQY